MCYAFCQPQNLIWYYGFQQSLRSGYSPIHKPGSHFQTLDYSITDYPTFSKKTVYSISFLEQICLLTTNTHEKGRTKKQYQVAFSIS